MSLLANVRVLNDPETLRLVADPLRLRLLELLRQQPRTVTELAGLLDVARTKLYYHVRLLEEHGLIAVDETRVVSGIMERRYRVTAYRLSVDKTLLGPTGDAGSPLAVYLSVLFDEVATEIQRAVQSGLIALDQTHEDTVKPRRLLMGRRWYRLTDDDVAELADRYAALQAEFADRAVSEPDGATAAHREPDGQLYEWLVGFYPVLPPEGDEDD